MAGGQKGSDMRYASAIFITAFVLAAPAPAVELQPGDGVTATAIKHVIVVIAENRSFDHLFGVYKPPAGETVFNLLSQGIVTEDGAPGPNYAKAAQYHAQVTTAYDPAPADKEPYATLPPLMTDGAPQRPSDAKGPPFLSPAAAARDHGLLAADLPLLLTGATGLPRHSVDTRLPNATALANGPYQLTPGIPYSAFAASPAHRFFQMWQQLDCSASHSTADNPSGCLSDLFPWVEVSVGAGSNGKPQPASFSEQSTGEGSTSMGFYNMARGDAPYLKELAGRFALNDNYHQAANGGTGANHIILGTGDMIWYSDGQGNAATPPANQIENPDPQPGTNNFYTQDGYRGGSYVDCADAKAPGVAPILAYLGSLSAKPNCEQGHYYLVNNYDPGYLGDGRVASKSPFTVPPSNVRTIGDALLEKQISFRYYGEGWNAYLDNSKDGDTGYCNICNFLQYTASIMTNAERRHEHIADLDAFYANVRGGTLPALAFIKPSGINDGHPASSRVDIFEAFLRRLVDSVQAQPELWADTAILITFDEGGGYWDSGYVQPLDFFGDGTRVPLIVVSPYAAGGHIVHSYTDHVSILKFIERNWKLAPLTPRSRDNLPNPQPASSNPYVPANSPAIGDLMDMFNF
jgi:phospholipase C